MNNQASNHIPQEPLNGRYQLQQRISQKAGRQTFLAHDLENEESVVVKILKFGSDFEWENLKLFEREAQILKTLSHPAIPKYLDYFEIDVPDCKGFALVQQYIEAQSLEAHLAAGETFSIAEIQKIAEDCLMILIDLHQQNPPLVHRDLKPSNILLTNRSENGLGQIYLVDFGAVQNQVALGEGTFTVVGTYGYMPPEQFGGRSVPASDLYSLGATLIYLLTKVHPANLPQKDLRIQFEQVTQLSPEFRQWLGKMVEPSLSRRFSLAQIALQALKQPELVNCDALGGRKPEGSKVFLDKDTDVLQILLPPKGFSCASLWGNMISTLHIIPLGTMAWLAIENWVCSIPLGGWFAWACLKIWTTFLFEMRGKIRIRIDRDSISRSSEIFSLEFHTSLQSPRQNITKLVCMLPYVIHKEGDSETPDQYEYISPSIRIWVNNQECILGSLTLPEQAWLAHELSNWLELPIEHCNVPIVKQTTSRNSD
jgi:serine/threonine protein kinase